MLHTTLEILRKCHACDSGYRTLRKSLPANIADDHPITLLHILESNGINDAIWALRATVEPTGKDMACEIACRAAERVLPIFEKRHPDDKRPREGIEAARDYGRGEITIEDLRKKRSAAASAAYASSASSASSAASAAASAAYASSAAAYAADAYAADAYASYAAYASSAAAYAADADADADADAEREARAEDFRELLSQY